MKQYKLRRLIIILFFSLFIFISGAIFLLPSFILTLYREKDMLSQAKTIEDANKGNNKAELVSNIRGVNDKIRNIKTNENRQEYYDIIQKIIEEKDDNLKINSFLVFDKPEGDKTQYEIQITGIAKTRDSLVKFKSEIEKSSLGAKVDLPVASLASDVDAEFVMRITIKQ